MAQNILEYTRKKRAVALDMTERIVERVHPQRVLLFGSVARGAAREMSDIDLMVIAESDLSFKERMRVLYEDLERHHDIDMLWYTPNELERMKRTSSFVRHALREAVTLYERTG